ncbi:hypothetical protein CC1G_12899 [Coprinopsis cinerea okayama7|uniref:Uncharacterized protein n=1 Tax=Coprinopsis cinerea (strain Okayama-7 / 130 / ATCC MYA-4618 / FGSC 9003) TaxID=240176 RepID=A8NAS2_COPC7|nr:hypothetical protein CC1G_12899 [Coprinopsis cinerea okayama7\|eukprot:XP_001831924.2 hypothetical protein CC1G_12899 [Coprinopsis cinerea okayama7\
MSRSKRPLQVWSWEVSRCGLFIGSRAGRTSSSSDPPLSIPHLPYRTYHSQSSIEEMALSEAELAAQALAMDKAEQVYMLISFFLEAVIYGVYVILFVGAVHLMLRDGSKGGRGGKFFLFSMFVMFALTTVYTAINVYRFVRAYAQNFDNTMLPVYYFRDFTAWDNFSYVIIIIILVLHADVLVIYRCFVIWGGNYYVIAVPTVLLLFSIAINAIAITWFSNPAAMDHALAIKFFMMIYPVNLAQNCLTTGLIAFKIWKQHRFSQKAGLRQSGGLPLMTVARIIIESASIYTLQQLVLLVLHMLNHRAQVIIHATMVPSVGIVFVLIAIRTHIARSDAPKATLVVPSYLRGESPTDERPSSSVGVLTMIMSDSDIERGFDAVCEKDSKESCQGSVIDDEKSAITLRNSVPPSPV